MYITCQNCHTRFIVKNNQIGVNGRRVRCSRCNHIWHQKLDYNNSKLSDFNQEQKNLEPIKTPLKNQYNNLPAVVSYIPAKNNVSAFQILSFIIFALVILLADNFQFLDKYNHITIENIVFKKIPDINESKITYKLSNNSAYLISDPLIRVRMFDDNYKIINNYTSIIKLNAKILPKHYIYISMNIKDMPFAAKYIDVSIGNEIGFLLDFF